MTTVVESQRTVESQQSVPTTQERKIQPVVAWAALGVAFFIAEFYVLGAWIFSGDATPTPVGKDLPPLWMRIVLRSWQIAGFAFLAIFLYYFLIRPWRRNGRISLDGLFCLVFATIWWQDSGAVWIQPSYTYNSYLWNLGNWMSHMPGYSVPNVGKIAEPIVINIPIYIYVVVGAVVFINWVMRKIHARRPHLGKLQMALICFGLFIVFDAILEPTFMFLGYWTYPGAVQHLSLFQGHYYQFPIYEAIFWGGTWATWGCLRYFKNDLGQTVAERGVEKLRVGERSKTTLRFLALSGVCNLLFLVVYGLGSQVFWVHQDPWPKDITNRSYFVDQLCGEGTGYACPSPDVPIPRGKTSGHVGENGQFVPARP